MRFIFSFLYATYCLSVFEIVKIRLLHPVSIIIDVEWFEILISTLYDAIALSSQVCLADFEIIFVAYGSSEV
jgi:hypothetical protein